MIRPGFELIEDDRIVSDLTPSGNAVVDVAMSGTEGVIRAIQGAGTYLMRDASAPPPNDNPDGKIWLQTSGTTGLPKWVGHDLAALTAKIRAGEGEQARWLLTFNPGSYAGLQVILSAVIGGHVLVAPAYGADVTEMAAQAVAQGVTHISGTPTFWRAFLMALGDRPLDLKAVTLGGEAADQAILTALRTRFPDAHLRHIYATTEAGTILTVSDGLAGFPTRLLGDDLAITDDTLRVCGRDTGDVVEVIDDRVLFRGRRDAMVNIGGVKVYPETVEAHLLGLPFIQEVRVTPKPNPITGHILTADILLKPFCADLSGGVEAQIRAHLALLPRAARPASLRFVDHIAVGATGKKLRT